MTTHAIVTPCLVSKGIRTWCGHMHSDPRVSDDFVSGDPENVDCEGCLAAMKAAMEASKPKNDEP